MSTSNDPKAIRAHGDKLKALRRVEQKANTRGLVTVVGAIWGAWYALLGLPNEEACHGEAAKLREAARRVRDSRLSDGKERAALLDEAAELLDPQVTESPVPVLAIGEWIQLRIKEDPPIYGSAVVRAIVESSWIRIPIALATGDDEREALHVIRWSPRDGWEWTLARWWGDCEEQVTEEEALRAMCAHWVVVAGPGAKVLGCEPATSIVWFPGTSHGPCASPCEHRACVAKRAHAESACSLCGKPIGYDEPFRAAGPRGAPEHTECSASKGGLVMERPLITRATSATNTSPAAALVPIVPEARAAGFHVLANKLDRICTGLQRGEVSPPGAIMSLRGLVKESEVVGDAMRTRRIITRRAWSAVLVATVRSYTGPAARLAPAIERAAQEGLDGTCDELELVARRLAASGTLDAAIDALTLVETELQRQIGATADSRGDAGRRLFMAAHAIIVAAIATLRPPPESGFSPLGLGLEVP